MSSSYSSHFCPPLSINVRRLCCGEERVYNCSQKAESTWLSLSLGFITSYILHIRGVLSVSIRSLASENNQRVLKALRITKTWRLTRWWWIALSICRDFSCLERISSPFSQKKYEIRTVKKRIRVETCI